MGFLSHPLPRAKIEVESVEYLPEDQIESRPYNRQEIKGGILWVKFHGKYRKITVTRARARQAKIALTNRTERV